jgi:hypothetical protein
MLKKKITVDREKNYLTMITNAVGSRLFAQLWVSDSAGEEEDISRGGELSCAIFVSGVLKLNDRLKELTATVSRLQERMLAQGWREVSLEEIKPGDVIFWNKRTAKGAGAAHSHVGFYIGHQKAISNSNKLKKIVRHSWNYGGRRTIVIVLRWSN